MITRASHPIEASQQAVIFCLYCEDVQSFWAALQEAGVKVGDIEYPSYHPRRQFRLADPDGFDNPLLTRLRESSDSALENSPTLTRTVKPAGRCRVRPTQRDASQLHHVTVDGLAEWIAWWEAQEASA